MLRRMSVDIFDHGDRDVVVFRHYVGTQYHANANASTVRLYRDMGLEQAFCERGCDWESVDVKDYL